VLNETACAADDDGRACHRLVVMTRPVPLCGPHKAEVALAIVPDLLRDQLATAHRDAASGISTVRDDLVTSARMVPHLPFLDGGQHDTVVYFIANGGRVKIGFTTNLKSRLSSLALRTDSVLLTLAGGPDLERALHAHFQAHRDGNTEWFELAPTIFRYITARQGLGAPDRPEAAEQHVTVVRRTRKARPGKKAPRRSPAEWVELASPVYFEELNRLGRQPTAVEFSEAINRARLGRIAPTTAKKIRADILDRADVPALTEGGL
jgi:hypothetical protein